MKIVIELDDNVYGLLKRTERVFKYIDKEDDTVDTALMRAVINGTLLPKGHGRLVDEQQIIDRFKPVEKFEYWRIGLDGLVNVLSDAPTIIEGSESE